MLSDRSRPPRRIRALLWRGIGLVYLAAAIATSLIHRAIVAGDSTAPATAWEMVLGFLSFGFASLGMLLMIGGARLRDEWRRQCGDTEDDRPTDPRGR